MKYIFTFLLLFGLNANAQYVPDTIFYNQSWNKCSRDSFVFRRIIQKKADLYFVHDYYNNDTLRMEGSFSSLSPDIKNGFFRYYFKSGHKRMEGEYHNTRRDGVFKTYDEATQRLILYEEFNDDIKNGKTIQYSSNGDTITRMYHRDTLSATLVSNGATNKLVIGDATETPRPDYGKIFSDILKKRFAEIPDSLKHIFTEITVQYNLDSLGIPQNIQILNSGNTSLSNLIIQSIREMPKWKVLKPDGSFDKLKSTIIAEFPSLKTSVNIYSTTMPNGNDQNIIHSITSGLAKKGGRFPLSQLPEVEANALTSPEKNEELSIILQNYIIEEFAKNADYDHKAICIFTMLIDVDRKGRVEGIHFERKENAEIGEIVKRVVYKYSHWPTDMVGGKPVASQYMLTINFPKMTVFCFSKSK